MHKRLIVLELNEVPYRVIDRFCTENPDSALARVMPRAARLRALLPDEGQLHPKISWQTFHRGVPDTVHGYREYNQIDAPGREANPTFLELARRSGRTVGCGASIGSWPIPGATADGHRPDGPPPAEQDGIAFWLCDPFAPTPDSIPPELDTFQRFNTGAVQQSSRNVRTGGMDRGAAVDLLKKMPSLGIKVGTCAKVARQLLDERRNRARTVRRRNVQSMLTFDVIDKQLRRTKPDIATVFLNHVAAAMHRYWAAAFPDDYQQNNMPKAWRATYQDEIDAAMSAADVMIARLLDTARQIDARIIIVGSMGQEGIEHEVTHNQLVMQDFPRFMTMLGFEPDDYERRPGMEPEYPLAFNDAAGLDAFDAACKRLDINGRKPNCKRVNTSECALLVDQYNVDFDHVTLVGQRITLADSGLAIEAIDDFAGSTAQHVPEGICLVLDPVADLSSHCDETLHRLEEVTASLLATLDVPVPDYMPEPVTALVRAFGGDVTAASPAPDDPNRLRKVA